MWTISVCKNIRHSHTQANKKKWKIDFHRSRILCYITCCAEGHVNRIVYFFFLYILQKTMHSYIALKLYLLSQVSFSKRAAATHKTHANRPPIPWDKLNWIWHEIVKYTMLFCCVHWKNVDRMMLQFAIAFIVQTFAGAAFLLLFFMYIRYKLVLIGFFFIIVLLYTFYIRNVLGDDNREFSPKRRAAARDMLARDDANQRSYKKYYWYATKKNCE